MINPFKLWLIDKGVTQKRFIEDTKLTPNTVNRLANGKEDLLGSDLKYFVLIDEYTKGEVTYTHWKAYINACIAEKKRKK